MRLARHLLGSDCVTANLSPYGGDIAFPSAFQDRGVKPFAPVRIGKRLPPSGLARRKKPCNVSMTLFGERHWPGLDRGSRAAAVTSRRSRPRRWEQRRSVRSKAAKQSRAGRIDGSSVS